MRTWTCVRLVAYWQTHQYSRRYYYQRSYRNSVQQSCNKVNCTNIFLNGWSLLLSYNTYRLLMSAPPQVIALYCLWRSEASQGCVSTLYPFTILSSSLPTVSLVLLFLLPLPALFALLPSLIFSFQYSLTSMAFLGRPLPDWELRYPPPLKLIDRKLWFITPPSSPSGRVSGSPQ